MLVSTDAPTRTAALFHEDVDGGFVIENRQDVEPVVEENKAAFSLYDERTPWKGDGFHKVASIPNVVWEDLVRRGITRDPKAFRKWLNDRDNQFFRTRPGRV